MIAVAANEAGKLWGGRFQGGLAPETFALSVSTAVDWRLALYDLWQTKAYAAELTRLGVIKPVQAEAIERAIGQMQEQIANGAIGPAATDEDVHSVIERELVARVGEFGSLVRAGRSRNDQVATDFRLYCRGATREIAGQLANLVAALVAQANKHIDSVMPGYTHLQRAQPVSLAQVLGRHAISFLRDGVRLQAAEASADELPLGSAALAGSGFDLDVNRLARLLGFSKVASNSVDAVASRDFAVDLAYANAMIGVHLSQLAEDIILWVSAEFGFAKLDDAFSTGSSIMPQKKNPDVAELARGKSAGLIGDLTSLLVLLKGLPSAYNRDLQEDKQAVFSGVDSLLVTLPAMSGLVRTLEFDVAAMAAHAGANHSLATELADWFVGAGVSFANAHAVTGRLVQRAESRGKDVTGLTPADLEGALEPDMPRATEVAKALAKFSAKLAVAARKTPSGTSASSVRAQLAASEMALRDLQAFAGPW